MSKVVVLGAVLVLTGLLVATAAGAKQRPAFSLTNGQTRWFLPDSLQNGELVGCVVNGHEIDAKVPEPPATEAAIADISWGTDQTSVSIQRHPNGATQITCGAMSGSNALPRPEATPDVIGQNGLALIRGPNHLAALERVFGQPTTVRAGSGSGHCSATWHKTGLSATFASRACTGNSVLVTATVSGSAWSSLTGVHIGDSLAQLSWEDPTAKVISTGNGQTSWQLASGGASHKAKLLAISERTGKIVSFTAVVS